MIYPPGDYRASGQVAAHVHAWQFWCLQNFVRVEQEREARKRRPAR